MFFWTVYKKSVQIILNSISAENKSRRKDWVIQSCVIMTYKPCNHVHHDWRFDIENVGTWIHKIKPLPVESLFTMVWHKDKVLTEVLKIGFALKCYLYVCSFFVKQNIQKVRQSGCTVSIQLVSLCAWTSLIMLSKAELCPHNICCQGKQSCYAGLESNKVQTSSIKPTVR